MEGKAMSGVKWQVQEVDGRWNDYPAELSHLLEQARQAGKMRVRMDKNCEVDMAAMLQLQTQRHPRRLKRVFIDASNHNGAALFSNDLYGSVQQNAFPTATILKNAGVDTQENGMTLMYTNKGNYNRKRRDGHDHKKQGAKIMKVDNNNNNNNNNNNCTSNTSNNVNTSPNDLTQQPLHFTPSFNPPSPNLLSLQTQLNECTIQPLDTAHTLNAFLQHQQQQKQQVQQHHIIENQKRVYIQKKLQQRQLLHNIQQQQQLQKLQQQQQQKRQQLDNSTPLLLPHLSITQKRHPNLFAALPPDHLFHTSDALQSTQPPQPSIHFSPPFSTFQQQQPPPKSALYRPLKHPYWHLKQPFPAHLSQRLHFLPSLMQPTSPSQLPLCQKIVLDDCNPHLLHLWDPKCFGFLMSHNFLRPAHEGLDEICPICLDDLKSQSPYTETTHDESSYDEVYQGGNGGGVLEMSKCQHRFHFQCLRTMYESGNKDGSIQCPQCKNIHGTKHGNCPAGVMEVLYRRGALPGFPDSHFLIDISYHVYPGIQSSNHPSPGLPFSTHGFPRHGYLPGTAKGLKVLKLLKEAWQRRLTFTVGTSATTGADNTVIWNEIHHKTEILNSRGHGYPDPNYLDNVLEELASQGVVDEDAARREAGGGGALERDGSGSVVRAEVCDFVGAEGNVNVVGACDMTDGVGCSGFGRM